MPDIRFITVNLDHYHTTNRLAAHAKERGPVTGGCPISSMVMVSIHGQHLYRELNYLVCTLKNVPLNTKLSFLKSVPYDY